MSKARAWIVEVKYTQEFIDLMATARSVRDDTKWEEAPTLGQGRPVAGRWQHETVSVDEFWANVKSVPGHYEYRVIPLVAQA